MLANHDPIFAEAAKTIYRVTEDERVRYHCDAIERGERTHRTLVNQLNEQEQQLADMNQQLSDRDQLLATKDKQLQKFQQKLKDKIQRKISKGKTLEQIADELEEDVENIRPLYEELLQNAK